MAYMSFLASNQRSALVDLSTDRITTVATGCDPTWSPDGNWIGYRDLTGTARLLGLSDATRKTLGRDRVLSRLHWSPDSKYVFVQEAREFLHGEQKCLSADELVTYRVSDGLSEDVYETCGLRDWYFGWIAAPGEWLRTVRSSR
jgi:hypothetical protein